MTISKRGFILGMAAGALAQSAASQTGAPPPSPALPVLPAPRLLEARTATAQLLAAPAPVTPVLGFDGAFPGPVLRAKIGEEINLRLINKLDQPTTLHWHGLRVDNAIAGVAGLTQEAIAPGASYDCRLTPRDSGLYWFHPHLPGRTAEQAGRGLYGALIVEEKEPPPCDHDYIAVLTDWKLDARTAAHAAFAEKAEGLAAGRIGTLVTLNGKPIPVTEIFAPGARIRLRLLNAANARTQLLTFENVQPFILAIDGQPCDAFTPVQNTIPVGPGARFDLMFDLPRVEGAEARLVLRSLGLVDGNPGAGQPVLVFKTAGAALPDKPPVASLPANPFLPAMIRLQDARRMDVLIEGGGAKPFLLNGRAAVGAGGSVAPLFAVKPGTPVNLGLINKTAATQAIRLHGHHMRLLHTMDDGWEPYWRDSILLTPGKTHHVAFVADNVGKWMIEAANMDHQAAGVRAWFEVG